MFVYDFESEAIFVHFILKRPEYIENLKSKYFKQKYLSDIFVIIRGFYNKYKVVPSIDTIKRTLHIKKDVFTSFWTEIDNDYIFEQSIFDKFIAIGNYEYDEYDIEEQLQDFIGYNKYIESVVDLSSSYKLESLNPNFNMLNFLEKKRREFNKNTMLSFDADLGSEWTDITKHESFVENRFTTGHQFLDNCLNGGYGVGELIVFFGMPGGGKSAMITDLASNSYKNNKNVLIVSLEMSEQIYLRRLSSNLLNIPSGLYDEIIKDKVEIKERIDEVLEKYFQLTNKGSLRVKSFPSGSVTVTDIEAFVNKLIDKTGVNFDIIYIDYLTIIKADGGEDTSYNKYKNVAVDLRAMASRLNCQVVTAIQVNRGGMKKDKLDLSDVSESTGVVHNADNVFAIHPRGEYEIQNSEIRIGALKLRNSDSQLLGSQMTYKFIGSKMTFIECNENNRDLIHQLFVESNFNQELQNTVNKASNQYIVRPKEKLDDIINKENEDRFTDFFNDF